MVALHRNADLVEMSLTLKNAQPGEFQLRETLQSMTDSEAMDWLYQKSE